MSTLPDTIDRGLEIPSEICVLAENRIRARMTHDTRELSCSFDEGRLILRGQVLSFYHKQLAQEAVANLDGISQVVNEIQVVGLRKELGRRK